MLLKEGAGSLGYSTEGTGTSIFDNVPYVDMAVFGVRGEPMI